MTLVKIISSVLLAGLIFFLTNLLIKDIKGPILYEEERSDRYEDAKENLIELRTAQLMYKKNKGEFQPDIDELQSFIKSGKITIEKVIGDPNDSTVVTKVIKEKINVLDTLLKGDMNRLENIIYIPYSGGKKFNCDAGFIEKNKVNVAVFEISAPLESVYNGLNKKYYDPKALISVGSMSEPKTSGNFE